MIALRWRDVDWDNGLLTIEKSASMAKNRAKKNEDDNNFVLVEGDTKNQKARTIQLTPEAKRILTMLYQRDISHHADDLIAQTETGKQNTASNLEHRMKVIMKNAGLQEVEGGLHIFRRTFATGLYEQGVRVEEIAAYIGDLESTTRKYYIAIRKKLVTGSKVKQVVKLPEIVEKKGIEEVG
jgi:integrase